MQDSSNFQFLFSLPAGARWNQHIAGGSFRDESVGVGLKQKTRSNRFLSCHPDGGNVSLMILISLLQR